MVSLKHRIPDEFLQEEPRELRVSPGTKAVWAVELDLLAEFDAVCKAHNLKYTIAYGTLLGAVRHKGFIPWDNDVDVLMLRGEYEKLCSIAGEVFKAPYFFQTDRNTPQAARGHAQLRNSETTGILRAEMVRGKPIHSFNQGIFLDVFPLDSLPEDAQEHAAWVKQLQACKARIRLYRDIMLPRRVIGPSSLVYALVRPAVTFWERLTKRPLLERLSAGLEETATRYRGTGSPEVAMVVLDPAADAGRRYRRDAFENPVPVSFEHLTLPGPDGAESILTVRYGNWHEHVIGGEVHGGIFFDVTRSYRDYLKEGVWTP